MFFGRPLVGLENACVSKPPFYWITFLPNKSMACQLKLKLSLRVRCSDWKRPWNCPLYGALDRDWCWQANL